MKVAEPRDLKNLRGSPKATQSENSGARIPTQVDNSHHSATFRDRRNFRDCKGQPHHFVDVESEIWSDLGSSNSFLKALILKKGMTEDEMVGWHHQLNGHEFG